MHRRSWVGVGTLVVVGSLIAGGAVWARGYEPLVAGSYSQQPDGSTVTGVTTLKLRWEPGSTQVVTVSVRNEGRRPVTMTGLTYVDAELSPVKLGTAKWAPVDRRLQLGTLAELPATVAAGEEVAVQVSVRQLTCGWAAGTGYGNDLLQIRTEAFGLAHSWRARVHWEGFRVSAPADVPARFTAAC